MLLNTEFEMGKKFFCSVVTAVALMGAMGLCGCSPKVRHVPVETVRTEYREADTAAIYNRLLMMFESRREKESRSDSIIDREKETVVLNVQGDTVRLTRTQYVYVSSKREKELERENKTLRDSLSVLNIRLESIKTDSVPVIVPVERELSRWERVKMDFGGLMAGAVGVLAICVAAIIGWMFLRRKFNFKK